MQQRQRLSRQRGMSTLGWLGTILLAGLGLTIAFKLGPVYIDNQTISASLNSLKEKDLAGMSNREIRSALSRYFAVNNVRSPVINNIEIDRNKGVVTVSLAYEERVHLFGNIDVVLVFDNRVSSRELVE